MGMYDCVTFTCPKCNNEAQAQTKSGPCIMMEFNLEFPLTLEEATIVNGMIVNCHHCHTNFEVTGDLPTNKIRMQLKEE